MTVYIYNNDQEVIYQKLKILAISDDGFLWRSLMELDFKESDREVK